jgi:glucose-6-phosphate-specific signal transduction histidine kinase
MAELSRTRGFAMSMSMITQINAHRWNGAVLGVIIVVMVHLTAATNAGRFDDPWPVLLSIEPASIGPDLALLHQRAHGSLEKLVQSARVPEQPL